MNRPPKYMIDWLIDWLIDSEESSVPVQVVILLDQAATNYPNLFSVWQKQ